MESKLLDEIGLTHSESKIYLALLELGPSTKGPIVKKAKISPSKIYEVIDKLMDKGLVSYIIKNNVKHFRAASPLRIGDYLEEKRQKIALQETILQTLLPQLQSKEKTSDAVIDAEVFRGWKGMKTVYSEIVNSLKGGETSYIFGAGMGSEPEKADKFFEWFNKARSRKRIKVKIIFNESVRAHTKRTNPLYQLPGNEIRYIKQVTPAEINIYKNVTLIVILAHDPLIIKITGKEVYNSFKQYFDAMWKIAKI